MKYLLIALLLVGCTDAVTQNNPVRPSVPVYHVRIAPFAEKFPGTYVIEFTNDNWRTTQMIFEYFDLSGQYDVMTVWQEKIFQRDNACVNATNYARRFTTYQSCIDNNNRSYKQYLDANKWYAAHPKPKEPKEVVPPAPPECSINKNIY